MCVCAPPAGLLMGFPFVFLFWWAKRCLTHWRLYKVFPSRRAAQPQPPSWPKRMMDEWTGFRLVSSLSLSPPAIAYIIGGSHV
ncbi:hypothetical protein LZ30DRAFT_727450 [Colletotrichum cereale]|nr:hypothetical protein LZ30DRAFT_727450 [Colletotrichum cereale]